MASSILRSSRYQREQRFTVISWSILIALGATLAAYHDWAINRSAPDEDAALPVAPTLTMHAWLDRSQLSIDGVVAARNSIAAAAAHQDIPATGAACQLASEAVADLRYRLPSPEAAVNQSLQQAISSYTLGLPDCVSASHTEGGEGMQRAAWFISQGDCAMQTALDILGDTSGRAPVGVLIV